MLRRIARCKWEEIIQRKKDGYYHKAFKNPLQGGPTRSFLSNLSKTDGISVIAELKKASPSKGVFRPDYHPESLARSYQSHGANALSVLTDRNFFQGHESHILKAKGATNLPVLRKDFLVDAAQIYESRYIGADAVLLIASLLVTEELKAFIKLAEELGMESVVEVFNEEEATRAAKAGAKIVQINNRDLRNFTVDLRKTEELAPLIPRNAFIVAASGISSGSDAQRMKKAGAGALLVGEALVKEDRPGGGIKELKDSYETCAL